MTETELEVLVEITRYEVSVLPAGDINRRHFTIAVESRGEGRWAATRYGECLGKDGAWSYESIPSERTDEWLADHRFTLRAAIDLATKAAPHLTVNGHTAIEAYHRTLPASPAV